MQELDDLQAYLQMLPYNMEANDPWTPVWGSKYSSRRFYSYIFRDIVSHPIFKALWKSRCTPRVKFFAWLILVDRLNTKSMLHRWHLNIEDDALCIMCDSS
jgi:hypothetical protein